MKKFLPIILSSTLILLNGCSFPFLEQSSRPIISRPQANLNRPTPVNSSSSPIPESAAPGTNNEDHTETDSLLSSQDQPEGENGSVSIFLVALNDKGESGKKIGCDDSVVPVTVEADSPDQETPTLVKTALQKLLDIKDQEYGESGFSNSLASSTLKVDSVSINNEAQATVKLSGKLVSNGACDDPRQAAQLTETVLQFPEIKSAEILLNGKKLSNY